MCHWNIRSGRPKVKVTLEGQIFVWTVTPTILHNCSPSWVDVLIETFLQVYQRSRSHRHMWRSNFDRPITPTFMDKFQYKLAQLFSITCRCAIWKICSGASKVMFVDHKSIHWAWHVVLDNFLVNLLPHMPISGSPNSAANKNMMSKMWTNGAQLSDWIEKIVGKEEIARYEQFLLLPQCFQKLSVADASKWVFMD